MIVELRQYTLHPGKRDTLIDLFEREFVTGQQDCGMRIFGRYHDLDDADRFVWFRGFDDMEQRKESLTCFYGGPVWRAHRDVANGTMIDSDDVLLLRPCEWPPETFNEQRCIITTYSFNHVDDDLVARVQSEVNALAMLRTEHAENTFPALPVREGEQVIVTIARDEESLSSELAARFVKPPHRMRLESVAR
jgi:hypothetical protein